jgi:hypothetical protein
VNGEVWDGDIQWLSGHTECYLYIKRCIFTHVWGVEGVQLTPGAVANLGYTLESIFSPSRLRQDHVNMYSHW